MRFAISSLSGNVKPIELTEEQYQSISSARKGLVEVLYVEDKFDLVLQNFAEFEKELLGIATDSIIQSTGTWSKSQAQIQLLNRRLTNVLSSARLYLDQIKHHANSLGPAGPAVHERLKTQCSAEYDSRLGYRTMEALRNYAQHRDLPIHRLSIPSGWELVGNEELMVTRVIPQINTNTLREDGGFKPAILGELEAIGEFVPLTPFLREYVGGLANIQESFRDGTAPLIAAWEATWEETLRLLGEGVRSAAIGELGHNGQSLMRKHIFDDLLRHRRELAAKNRGLGNMHRRCVSGIAQRQ